MRKNLYVPTVPVLHVLCPCTSNLLSERVLNKMTEELQTTNRFKQQMKNNKIVLSLMRSNYETPNLLSRFPLSLTLVVI